jgi:hypothetical protein
LDVEVIGTGVGNEVSALRTPMQTFDGKKIGSHIEGTITVKAQRYEGKDSPPFPSSRSQSLTEWLKPSAHIESDHSSIVAKSAELTKGATTQWEATLRIGRWVHKEIRYSIADTPSARLALEKRQGDCGPHATLAVALLRAAGIPARLVGGLMYSPTFGGTFAQHAWVEAYMAPAGWIAFDPTTGEFESMNATHIKLFEGMGGVLPKSVHVVAFQPPNRKIMASAPAQPRPMPWKLDNEYTFRYVQDGQEIGREVMTLSKVNREGKDHFQVKSDTNLKAGNVAVLSKTTLVATAGALPLSFYRDLDAGGQKYTFDCKFLDGAVAVKISGAKEIALDVKLPDGCYCFDNNLMASWVLICSQLNLEAGKNLDIRAFHPSSLQTFTLSCEPSKPEAVKISGKEMECYRCEVPALKNSLWVTRDGRFVKTQQGKLVVELVEGND